MKGTSKALLKFMEGSDKRFVIPIYQRNYDWKKENCRQLLTDLINVIKGERPSHFFGSIVALTEGDDYIIIDGQQRLTTVSLLLLALMNVILEGKVPCQTAQLADKIKEDYLIDKWQPDDRKIKLKPIKSDMLAFASLFHCENDFVEDSNLTQNYLFFYEETQQMDVSSDDLFNAIKKLVIIDITLEHGDEPQLIFESLNSTGLDLSEADKIRNYVLMGLDQQLQEHIYEQYWNKIEKKTHFHVSAFIRQYLTFRQNKWPNINHVYETFKAYSQYSGADIESQMSDMLDTARLYEQLMTANTGYSSVDIVLRRLNRLDRSVANPLLFALLGRMQMGTLSPYDTKSALLILESFLVRRMVCEVPTNALNNIFATINNDVEKQIDNDSQYVPAMISLLQQKTASGRFPLDLEFEEKIRTRDFYNMNARNKVYLFDRLENGDTLECLDVAYMMTAKDNSLSVEHIMPQTLTEGWKSDLGPDFAKIHNMWKNRIANLTLTAYNSKYSNSRFTEKLHMKNGFKDSPLPLNKWIAEQTQWGLVQLEQRSEILAQKFLELWPYPKTSFVLKGNSGIEYGLNDEFNFTGSKIISYSFRGTRQIVSTWRGATEGILREIYALDPANLTKIAAMDDFLSSYLHTDREEGNGWYQVGQNVFVYLATSTESKLRLLEKIFYQMGLDTDDLIFEIKHADE